MTPRKKKTEEPPPAEAPSEAASTPDHDVVEVSEETVPMLDSNKMVVFFLEGQRYALPIGRVQEIQQIVAYTEMPDESGVTLGMVNMRGLVVPLVDMRALLGLQPARFALDTPMVICRLGGQLVALVVDEVEDVTEMPEGCLQRPSKMHALADRLLGVCRMEAELIFLLDLDRLMSADGLMPVAPGGGGRP
ncbi:MAG: hypothetical protein C0418_01340 [Coriobacteriaceae bacterium]|nr:hypothetical protein [Coriobacteriaceae bacterium]